MSLAAVVVGVDVTGGLTPLSAAASGAEEVAAWLEQEGYDVFCLTDRPDPGTGAPRPLKRQAILDAITALVDKGSVEKLVIYFAGHGYLNATSEIWLLSGAPDDPNEAIDETLSAEMARGCNIRNVVFISDACRSAPVGVLAQRVAGGTIFPNRLGGAVEPEIDHFFATRPGASAIETKLADLIKATGLFTKVLQDSHIDPPRDQLIRIGPKEAVPSRWLRTVLPERVDEAAQGKSLALTQRAQIRLESDQNAFIALARFSAKSEAPEIEPPDDDSSAEDIEPLGANLDFPDADVLGVEGSGDRGDREDSPPPPRRTTSRRRTAARKGPAPKKLSDKPSDLVRPFAGLLSADAGPAELGEVDRQACQTLASRRKEELVPAPGMPAWILVRGEPVARATVARTERVADGARWASKGWIGVKLAPNARACSVAIEFANGSGAVVAAIRDYLCRLTVSDNGVEEVNYDPIAGYRADVYRHMREEIDRVRAVASAAAAHGMIEIDRSNAAAFANATRRYKMFDPSLGMIAAGAYAAAGLRDRAASVLSYARSDLGIDLYDLWLLAGAEKGGPPRFPFCPMMTQSWSFLAARGIELPPAVAEAGRLGGFWTTFSKGEMPEIAALLKEGTLK